MHEPPVAILGHAHASFVRALAPEVPRVRALEAYRRVFRDGDVEAARALVAPRTITLPSTTLRASTEEAGTVKFTLDVGDGLESESVIIPGVGRGGRPRQTLCLSSQIGCAMGCRFCETAQMGLMRNLDAERIVAQWFAARFEVGQPIDNLVFMGMGEPMDNLDAVLAAIEVLVDHNGPSIAPSRITVSTVGRTEGIRRYAEFTRRTGFGNLGLAVSVNAPNDAIRSDLMPINRAEPLDDLIAAMRTWPRGILIEYVLIPGVNDERAHAEELCDRLAPLETTVNVIPYNPRRDSPWPAPEESAVETFIGWIAERGQRVKRRQTRGRSVMAACGQLGNERIRRRRFVELGGLAD